MNLKRKPDQNRDWLYEQYVIRELSQREIAKSCGVFYATVGHWMKKSEIKARKKNKNKGYRHSEETKRKISTSHNGLHTMTPEIRARLLAANLGHHRSAETKAKISAFQKGRQRSAETRAKIGAAHRKNGRLWTSDDYERIYVSPGHYVLLHRQIAENTIGRKLKSHEHVHHINKNHKDNRIENLAICSNPSAHGWCDSEEAKIFFGQ